MSKVTFSPQAGATLLAGAIKRHNLDAVHTLLFEDKVDPNAMEKGETMLHIAARMGYDREISMLLEAGADVHRLNENGNSILRGAIRVGHGVSVKKLLEAGADPTATGVEENGVALIDAEIAAQYGSEVSWPVGKAVGKFNVNRAARDWNLPLLDGMLKTGEPADTFDRFGKTGLYEAVEGGFNDGVERLLGAKANPNLPMKANGWTAMHAAADTRDPAMLEKLFRRGGKMNAKTADGLSLTDIARRHGNREMLETIQRLTKLEEIGFAALASKLTEDVASPVRAKFSKRPKPPTP